VDVKQVKKSRSLKILLLIVTVVLIVLMFPRGESIDSTVEVNSIWIKDDLIASQTFEILKDPIIIEKERLAAVKKIFPIFIKDNLIPDQVFEALNNNNTKLIQCLSKQLQLPDSIIDCNTIGISQKSVTTFVKINNNNIYPNYTLKQVFSFCKNEIKRIYRRGYINQTFSKIEKDTISIRDGKFEVKQLKESFYDSEVISNYLDQRILNSFDKNIQIKNAIKEYLILVLAPNILFSKSNTDEAKKIVAENIPINLGIVNENERIVAKHDRITPDIKSKIDSYRIAKGFTFSTWDTILQNIGKFMHITLLFIPLIIYLYLFRKKILFDNQKLLLIVIIILFVSASAFLVGQIEVDRSLELLILVPVASMLLTIVFDSRIGFYVTVIVSLIIAGIRGNDYILAATNIIVGGLAAYTVRDIKNRNQIFHSFLYILSGYILSILAFGLERFD